LKKKNSNNIAASICNCVCVAKRAKKKKTKKVTNCVNSWNQMHQWLINWRGRHQCTDCH